jgi:hypothetical protein
MHFLRELKEEGIIVCDWMSGNDNPADLFTKNLPGPLFDKHASSFVGRDEYMKKAPDPAAAHKANEAKGPPKKPYWKLRPGGKTAARVRHVNYHDNFK